MGTNSGYRVNEDGSVTRLNSDSDRNQTNKNSNGGSSNNNGCVWWFIVAIIVIFIIILSNVDSKDSTDSTYVTDQVEVEAPIVAEDSIAVDILETVETPSTTYLSVSDDNIYFDADGGETEIEVSTDGDWDIDVGVVDWGHLRKYSTSVTVRVDKNPSTSSRTDYFVLKSGNYSKRINITQYGNTSPSADIENIWIDHSVYQNGVKGMKIHVEFTVDNMNGKTIYAYAFFYWGDNITPLHDPYGNNLSFYGDGTPNYDSARFDDFIIFVPYVGLNMQPGQGSVSLSFDISIRTSSGTELDRENNTQITYTN